MNDEEIFNFEDRTYLTPTKSRDEQTQFIDTLRETMGNKTAQINADTYALGTQVPSNLGGLSGAEGTFTARYQTPQLNQTAADLRTAAQQTALNQALSNLQNAWKKRYNDAVLNYQKRAATPATSGDKTTGNTEFQGQDAQGWLVPSISGTDQGTTVTLPNGQQGVWDLNGNFVVALGDNRTNIQKVQGAMDVMRGRGVLSTGIGTIGTVLGRNIK